MYKKSNKEIVKVITNYFEGIYYGDVDKLETCFTNDAILYGDINGIPYKKSKDEYLEGVRNRKSPEELNEIFDMKIIGIEIIGNVGIAKLHVPMLGYNYYDFLSFSKVSDNWKIVNKIFSHVE